MNEDESLRRYGLHPAGADLDEIREILHAHSELEWPEQDTALMRLCSVQLFHAGQPDDILRIWQAKESGFDAHCSIDVQLLCGTGLEATKAHLTADGSDDATKALTYLLECEAEGDFDEFSVSHQTQSNTNYYQPAD